MSKRELFTSSEALVALAIMVVVGIFSTLGTSLIGTGAVVLIGVVLTLITIDTGGHAMLVFSGAFLLLALGLAIDRLEYEGAVPWALAGLIVLAYADAIRLCFAGRRHGTIEGGVYRGVFVGLGIVGVSTAVVAGVVAGLANAGANANWLLVPLALVLAVVGLVGLAVAVSRSPGQHDKRRWNPGERLMPPPRAASDDPSFKTSTPPPPQR